MYESIMSAPTLRPVERRVQRASSSGVSAVETASRLRRSPEYVRRIQRFTNFEQSRSAS